MVNICICPVIEDRKTSVIQIKCLNIPLHLLINGIGNNINKYIKDLKKMKQLTKDPAENREECRFDS